MKSANLKRLTFNHDCAAPGLVIDSSPKMLIP
jgi:hypothetical protein